MSHHLGHEKLGRVVNADSNTRNATSKKTLKGKNDEMAVNIPRDRKGSFEPRLVEKRQTHQYNVTFKTAHWRRFKCEDRKAKNVVFALLTPPLAARRALARRLVHCCCLKF